MKFLLDMGLAQSTAHLLRDRGYDAVHLRDQALQRLDDQDIVAKAIHEVRIILTHDLDFGRIVALSHAALPSVVTFRLADIRAPNVNHYLDDLLYSFGSALSASALVSVSDQSIRIRSLPIE